MLMGFMSLPNQNMYIQFHPVVYMGKLNIEMSSTSRNLGPMPLGSGLLIFLRKSPNWSQ